MARRSAHRSPRRHVGHELNLALSMPLQRCLRTVHAVDFSATLSIHGRFTTPRHHRQQTVDANRYTTARSMHPGTDLYVYSRRAASGTLVSPAYVPVRKLAIVYAIQHTPGTDPLTWGATHVDTSYGVTVQRAG